MGLFKNFFSASNEEKQEDGTPWIELNSMEQLDEMKGKSESKPQFIFKHSTRCGISRMVMNQFKKDYKLTDADADLYYLDLLNHRAISTAIADRFNVVHESPQLLVVKDGALVVHASHGGINDLPLEKFVD